MGPVLISAGNSPIKFLLMAICGGLRAAIGRLRALWPCAALESTVSSVTERRLGYQEKCCIMKVSYSRVSSLADSTLSPIRLVSSIAMAKP